MRGVRIAAATAGTVVMTLAAATAAELPATKLKVLASFSNLNMFKSVEMPFWTQTVPKESGGKISVDLVSLDTLGLKGTETLRLMKLGVVDFASGNLSYMSADGPAFDGTDLAGLLTDIKTAREATEAYRSVMADLMKANYNSKLLMLWPAPPQIIYCKPKIASLDDLKGKKVRVYNKTLADFVQATGGTPVTVAWPEVVPAFQRGTIDCGVTGTLSGNTAKWWEVTDYLYPLYLGWAIWFHAVNMDTWNRLDPKVQSFLEGHFKKVEDKFWQVAAEEAQDGINCNTGKGTCTYGVKGQMTLVPVSEADKAKLKKLLGEVIVPSWGKLCGEACVKDWNNTIGKVVGINATAK